MRKVFKAMLLRTCGSVVVLSSDNNTVQTDVIEGQSDYWFNQILARVYLKFVNSKASLGFFNIPFPAIHRFFFFFVIFLEMPYFIFILQICKVDQGEMHTILFTSVYVRMCCCLSTVVETWQPPWMESDFTWMAYIQLTQMQHGFCGGECTLECQ